MIRDAGPYARTTHPQVWIDHPAGGGAHVDESIAELLLALWARGLVTTASCADQVGVPDMARIGFLSLADAQRFRDLAKPERTNLLRLTPEEIAAEKGYVAAIGVHFSASRLQAIATRVASTVVKRSRARVP